MFLRRITTKSTNMDPLEQWWFHSKIFQTSVLKEHRAYVVGWNRGKNLLTLPLMKIFITHRSLSYFSVNRIQIKMLPHRFIYGIINPVFNLYFRFELFIRKLDNSLCISLIIILKRISMIDTHKHVIIY